MQMSVAARRENSYAYQPEVVIHAAVTDSNNLSTQKSIKLVGLNSVYYLKHVQLQK